MFEENFYQGDSFFHRADPRGKVICASLLVVTIALLERLFASGAAFLMATFFLAAARLPAEKVIKRLVVVNTFIAFLWVFLPFSVPGKAVFSVWGRPATAEGIKLALLITIKCNAILLVIICFIATTPFPLLGFALTNLRVPGKLTLLMLISYRYISVIQEEYDRLLEAAKVRCFVPRNNIHTYRTYAYLVAMVLVRSYERGLTVYQAMVLRGFKGRFYSLRKFHFGKGDVLLSMGVALCIGLLLYFDRAATVLTNF
ncbi:MAG: cobalt ECF transporter T component CbiQ [Deltaproteobacteria bacterium]|nr:MAG: cobalt ECF transporter T component CbiQ [Deltaproteobacteria bacterium]